MSFRLRLLALDIDATLTGADHTISAANIAATAEARAAGIEVILITGRRYKGSAEQYAAQLGLGTLTYCYCGASAVRPDGVVDEHRPLPFNLALDIARFAHERNLPMQAYMDDAIYGEPSIGERARLMESLGLLAAANTIVPDLAAFFTDQGRPPTQLVPLGGEAVEAVREKFGALSAGEEAGPAGRADPTGPGTEYGSLQFYVHDPGTLMVRMTVLKGGVNKGETLARHCRRFGFLRSETAALGDSAMDAPMLAFAAHGVAMSTAPDWVKAHASAVAPAGDDAAAVVIRRLLDGQQGNPAHPQE
ncbi:MAG: HAD family hydrolase [Bacillota bacterium]